MARIGPPSRVPPDVPPNPPPQPQPDPNPEGGYPAEAVEAVAAWAAVTCTALSDAGVFGES